MNNEPADSSGDDSDDSEYNLSYIDVEQADSSTSAEAAFLARVGMEFIDLDDHVTFVIDSVCRKNNSRRRVSFAQLFFKYHDVDRPGEFEYTPCLEVLNSTWCQWKQTASSSAREQRVAKRQATMSDRSSREVDSPPKKQTKRKKT